MSYAAPITIKKAIDNIVNKSYVLPSIQREFVWDAEQIEMLFDSLMRGYPISTFLLWKVDKNKVKDFQFYEFIKNYHEKNGRHNIKANLPGNQDVIALLDGQQRMTSMYIALKGSYAAKLPYYRKNNAQAYPEKKLYLNLLNPSSNFESEYEFKFLTISEAAPSPGYFWFECAKILEMDDMAKVSIFLVQNQLMDTSVYGQSQSLFAIKTLNQFYNVIHQKDTINYYLEEGEELDKVLQIFIRINSGGTKLSYSDLLLSIATAQWGNTDAREVIHAIVDEINKIGDGFSFNKDVILKSCLVLSDFDVKFKVDNFTTGNMIAIERKWDNISSAIRSTIELVSKLGYNRDNLIANNAIIPVAYFVYKNNLQDSIVDSPRHNEDRKAIKEWLARVLLKGIFGGHPDSIYPVMRDIINANLGSFPIKQVIDYYKGKEKSLYFSDEDIDGLLDLQYGQAKTYCALTLLYPGLNYSFKYHQDHIHPASLFNKTKLKKLGIDDKDIPAFIEKSDSLPNLQLLEANQNINKNDKLFTDWVNATYTDQLSRESFLTQNHIKLDDSLSIQDFLSFIDSRRETIKNKFKVMLGL